MSLASYRAALLAVEAGMDLDTAVMSVLMLAATDDGGALAAIYPMTAEEMESRIMVEGGRLESDPPPEHT